MTTRKVLTLRHEGTGRVVPVDAVTVVGRKDTYYRYTEGDERGDRLRGEVSAGLATLNYIKISSDSLISRTHGVIDPLGPTISDLNSTNGTLLNERRVPGRQGDRGPPVGLSQGDVITLGRQRFAIELQDVTDEETVERLHAGRRGSIACDWARLIRAEHLARHLEEHKSFQMRPTVGWAAAIATCYALQSDADPEGVAVVGFAGDVRGEELVFDQEGMPFRKLLPLIARIPGRKVVVLDVDGDPAACEQLFAAQGYEDMLLLSCPGGPALEEPGAGSAVVGTTATSTLAGVKRGLCGEQGLVAANDDALDGLDALLGPDTNVLAVDWLKSYRGRLKVTFGQRPREDDSWLSHSLRLGSTTFRF